MSTKGCSSIDSQLVLKTNNQLNMFYLSHVTEYMSKEKKQINTVTGNPVHVS